ncbi:MAG TPA: hypothetical protein VGP48_12750 [Stellaceae bacterium]|jgi:hypothetical protein|nr:hypothetical protein [Stellaceae bacterium]
MRIALACWIAAGIAVGPAVASAACSAMIGAPAFTVALKDPPPNYRFGLDTAALARVAGENGMPGLKSEIPYGLTIGRYDLEIAVETDAVREGSGYCAQLRTAHIEIGLRQLDVLVDRRFPSGSCERDAVLGHESQHVDVFREAMQYYLPAVERTLATASLRLSTHVEDRVAARAAFLTPITDALKPIFEAINGRARDGNMRVDTPENYAAVFKRCSHW